MADARPAADHPGSPLRTGLLGAIEAEVSLLRDALTGREDVTVDGTTVHLGDLDGHPVALARCGVGKVNAALTTVALARTGLRELVFSGVAGGVDPALSVGDIVVSTDLVQHDVDVTALGRAPGELLGEPAAWPATPALVARMTGAARDVAADGVRVLAGRVATGDQFIASTETVRWLHETFGAACAEMEGAAMAQACARLGLPFVVVRSISDTADHAAVVDFPLFLDMAAPRGLELVRAYLAAGDGV